MMTGLAIIAAVGVYFLTMAVLLAVFGVLQFNVAAFGFLNVQPYRSMVKWAIIGASAWGGYTVFAAGS